MSDLHPDLREIPAPLPVPSRALTIGAHPDDAEFGAGATLARWAADGTDITLLVITDGSKGSWDAAVDPAALAATRRMEQEVAAGELGVSAVVHLDRPDGELENSLDLRAELCHRIRSLRPDVIFTHDPWQRYQLHPDHRAAGFAAVDAVVAARDPLFYPEQDVPPHRPDAVLLWSADDPDHAEPVGEIAFGRKVAALLAHASQAETTMGGADRSEDHRDRFVARVLERADRAGAPFGLEAAETFKRLTP